MSGIGGIWNIDGGRVRQEELAAMVTAAAHRGVHGSHMWIGGNVGLMHALTAVTPEDATQMQPLELGNSVISFDGRLDNRPELKSLLNPTRPDCTDAELAIRAYLRWGEGAPGHLIGDFVFGIWDQLREQLFCARDHIGIKVLHYYFDGHTFVFGSECRQLFANPRVPQALNLSRLALFLALKEVPGDGTFFKYINRLPAGHVMTVRRSGLTSRAFWKPEPTPSESLASSSDYVEMFKDAFQEAVRCRLRATGPVAATVSGGMDSTSVFVTAKYLREREGVPTGKLHSFSWVFPGIHQVDETPYIRQVTGEPGLSTHYVNGDGYWGLKFDRSHVGIMDGPQIAPYEALIRTPVKQAAGLGARVLLTGQGGEILTVGPEYVVGLLADGRWGTFLRHIKALPPRGRRTVCKSCLQEWLPGRRNVPAIAGLVPPWIDHRLLAAQDGNKSRVKNASQRIPDWRHFSGLCASVELTRQSLWPVWSDQLGAEFGLDMRHPLWDVRLVNFMLSLPPERNFDGRWGKLILRRAMNGLLPPDVCWRRDKTHFTALFDLGARGMERDRLLDMSSDLRLARVAVVDQDRFNAEYRRYLAGDATYRDHFWAVFVAEQWFRQVTSLDHHISPARHKLGTPVPGA